MKKKFNIEIEHILLIGVLALAAMLVISVGISAYEKEKEKTQTNITYNIAPEMIQELSDSKYIKITIDVLKNEEATE